MVARYRKKGALGGTACSRQDVDGPLVPGGTSGPVITSYFPPGSSGDLSECSDQSTPNFRKLQSEGQVIMNACSIVKTNRYSRNSNIVLGTLPYWGSRTYFGDWAYVLASKPTYPTWFATRVTDWKYSTITSAMAKVAAPDFQGLVTVAEAHKTAQQLRRPFGRARDLIEKIVKRKARLILSGVEAAQAAATAWNEYRFGWKPLVMDIEGIAKAYHDSTAHRKPLRLVARASGTVTHSGREFYLVYPPGVNEAKMVRTFRRDVKISSGVLYELVDKTDQTARQRKTGLRLSDVPASVWELVPWSFIVDRFLTVGDWLQAITPKPYVNFLGSWTSTVDREDLIFDIVEFWVNVTDPVAGSVRLSAGGGSYTERNFRYDRERNPPVPIAPTFNPKSLGVQQQIDHLALTVDKIVGLGLNKIRTKNPW